MARHNNFLLEVTKNKKNCHGSKKRGVKVNDPKIFCPANDYESSNTSSGDNSTCRNNGDFNWGGRCCSNEFVDAAAPNDADGDNDDNEKEERET